MVALVQSPQQQVNQSSDIMQHSQKRPMGKKMGKIVKYVTVPILRENSTNPSKIKPDYE